MQTQRPNPDGDAGLNLDHPSIIPRSPYLESAPLDEVMFEQLEYLLAHPSANCTPECAECARLMNVEKFLLLPFRHA
jgi:hypothetical protein